MNPYFRKVAGLLFPGRCACCGQPADGTEQLCAACASRIRPILPPFCPFCGTSLADCKCRKAPHAYEQAAAPFYYEDAIRDALLRMKYGSREEVAVFFGTYLSQTIAMRYFGVPFTLITCVPATRKKTAERGFNQAESLVEQLNLRCFTWLPEPPLVDCKLLQKWETGEAQHTLGAEARRENIRNSYELHRRKRVEGDVILLIDDIVTTGATADEIAVLLRLHGAKAVYVASAALTRNTGAFGSKKKAEKDPSEN